MGWQGALVGAIVGGRFGLHGAIVGAVIGHLVQKHFTIEIEKPKPDRQPHPSGRRPASSARREENGSAQERAAVFCTSAAAIMAKMAKADGRVSEAEIAAVENAFSRLGFSEANRRMAVSAFRQAKDDARSIYVYANRFASVVRSLEVRELFYEMLWDLACADGVVSEAEDGILRTIPSFLGIPPAWYSIYARERRARRGGGRREEPSRGGLEDAYATLGVSPNASDDEVKSAYRAKAKKYHPDTLRAQGLPDEMIGRATEQMARINDAWSAIRRARGL